MTASLTAKDRDKLAKLLAMLGSNHAGERDAAGIAAHRLVQSRGVAWADLLTKPPAPPREPLFGTWRTTCAELARRSYDLRPWERSFVADLPRFNRISTKQRYCLNEIARRVLGGAG